MGNKPINIKYLLITLLVLPFYLSSQIYDNYKVAVINDIDGYTFIRSGQGTNTPIIDTLFEAEFFQFLSTDTNDWYKVFKMWNVNGFVHKSRIKDIKTFNRTEQQKLITSIFNKEKEVYQKRISNTDYNKELALYHDEKFDAILDLFIFYMNKEFDEKLMRDYFDILIIEKASADELPSLALGEIFIKHPNEVIKLVKEYNNEIITGHLDFGYLSAKFYHKNDIDFKLLDKKINELKNK